MTDKVVLAYSGGLDTSIIIPWLQEHHRLEVHCYCGDIGQGDEELRGLEQKAKQTERWAVRSIRCTERSVPFSLLHVLERTAQ